MTSQIFATLGPPPAEAGVDQILMKAIADHQAWRFDDAENGYRSILELDPRHTDANHNLGVLLAVQLLKPADALPYLEAALDADPHRGQFWLSYIDALAKSGAVEAALQVLPLAKLHGLNDDIVARLADELAAAQRPAKAVAGSAWVPSASEENVAVPSVQAPAAQPRPRSPRSAGPSAKEMTALVNLFNKGDYAQGEGAAAKLSRRYGDSGAVWKILGAILHQLGKHTEALHAKRMAAQLLADDAEAHCNLGNTLVSAGLHSEAVESFLRAQALRPNYAHAHFNHGNALLAMELFSEAEAQFRRAREISPNWPDAHSNLGFSLKAQGRLAEAAESYSNALAAAPGDATTLTNLGLLKDALGLGEEALLCFKDALAKQPELASAHGAHGSALHKLGRLSLAENAYRMSMRRNVELQPHAAVAYFDLGTNLIEQKNWDEAEATLRKAIELAPDYADAHINLSKALYERGDYERAITAVQESLQLLPGSAALHANLGVSYTVLGRVDDAIACYRRALAIDPDFNYARSCMLYALSHSTEVDVATLTREHLAFGERALASVAGKVHTVFENGRDPERALRVGFVSADFRNHAIAKFFTPFIEAFAQRPGFTTYAYYNHAARDRMTESIQQHFNVWRPVVGLSDERLAAQIREDAIDILIDLSGHTAGNRLVMFARRPAPVQVTWLGYPGTTGITGIDYRIVEHYYGESEVLSQQFVEKFAQLPAVSAFNGLEAMPDVNQAPVLANGFITFGSFNRLSKVNRDVIAAWCRVLRAVPTSKLLMAAMSGATAPTQVLEWFEQEGIAADRLSFYPRTNFYDYLCLHGKVDVCLDTFPYTGGTTTNHALWMGVPTLTVAGDTYVSRQSAMFLHRMGLNDGCISTSIDGMVEQGVYWAHHPEQLQEIRSGLRAHLLHAHGTQRDTVVAGLAQALRVMWRRQCAELPVAGFRVEYEDIGLSPLLPLMEKKS
jgi:protein O-GlcNAc transferase